MVKQNNEFLMKNHEVYPIGFAPFPKVNVHYLILIKKNVNKKFKDNSYTKINKLIISDTKCVIKSHILVANTPILDLTS